MIVAVDQGAGLVVLSNSDAAIPVVIGIVSAWATRAGVEVPPLY